MSVFINEISTGLNTFWGEKTTGFCQKSQSEIRPLTLIHCKIKSLLQFQSRDEKPDRPTAEVNAKGVW